VKNLRVTFEGAEKAGIPILLDPEYMRETDAKSIMTQLTLFKLRLGSLPSHPEAKDLWNSHLPEIGAEPYMLGNVYLSKEQVKQQLKGPVDTGDHLTPPQNYKQELLGNIYLSKEQLKQQLVGPRDEGSHPHAMAQAMKEAGQDSLDKECQMLGEVRLSKEQVKQQVRGPRDEGNHLQAMRMYAIPQV